MVAVTGAVVASAQRDGVGFALFRRGKRLGEPSVKDQIVAEYLVSRGAGGQAVADD